MFLTPGGSTMDLSFLCTQGNNRNPLLPSSASLYPVFRMTGMLSWSKKSRALCVPELSILLIFSDFFPVEKFATDSLFHPLCLVSLKQTGCQEAEKGPLMLSPRQPGDIPMGLLLSFTPCRKPSQEDESSLSSVRKR